MNIFSSSILKNAKWVLVLGSFLSLVSVFFTIKLFMNLRTDLEELLPSTSRSVVDMNEVTRRLTSTDSLAAVVFSKDIQGSRKFVDALAEELKKVSPKTIAGVEHKIDEVISFFEKRQALYMELGDLKRIRDFIRARMDYEIALHNPLTFLGNKELREPTFDFDALERKYREQQGSGDATFPGGYYASKDERVRIVLAHIPGKSSDIDASMRLKKAVVDAIQKVDPKKYANDIEIHYTGGVQDILEEHDSLIEDLGLSSAICVLLVTLVLLFFYRDLRGTIALVISTFMGTLWCFGVSYFVVGYVNSNSAFLGAIVIGNGINFGIILLARYLEERRRGEGGKRAIEISMDRTWKATVVAALAAGFSYGSLAWTDFRGFSQFGIIGLIGMVLCWVSAFTVLPAMLQKMEELWPSHPISKQASMNPLTVALAWCVEKMPLLILLAAGAVTVYLVLAIKNFQGEIFETNLDRLRDKRSLETGSGHYTKYLFEIFGGDPHPIVVLAKNPDEANLITEKLREVQATKVATIRSVKDFVPTEQVEKIKVIHQIRKILTPRIVSMIPEKERKQVTEFLGDPNLSEVNVHHLPYMLRARMAEKDGTVGNLVMVEPPLQKYMENVNLLIDFTKQVRSIADSVRPGTPVAGTLIVTADMIDAIQKDGPRATVIAFLAVVVLVFLLFRRITPILLVVGSLLLGVLWLTGIIFSHDLKINFLNFIALPITFGIGVDYAVNIYQRYQFEGRGGIGRAVRETGGAVAVASSTTIIGFGALLIAGNQAFVSFGKLAVYGELTCVVTALVVLPAAIQLMDRLRWRR